MTTRSRTFDSAAASGRRRAVVRALLTAAPFAFAPAAHSAEPTRTPDAVDLDLLEFLGSGDDGDPELQSFLAAQPNAAAATGSVNTKPATDKAAPGTGSNSR